MSSHRSPGAPAPDVGVSESADDFRILLVCTANLCRSPLGQYLLDSAISTTWSGRGRWTVESAGVSAADNRPMHHRAAKVLAEVGLDGSQFRTRRLRPSLVRSADLVLTATREHRAAVARMHPAALRRLFTIKQFGYLLAHTPATSGTTTASGSGRFLLEAALAARGQVPARTVEDDLADPVNRPVRAFRECRELLFKEFAQIRRLITRP